MLLGLASLFFSACEKEISVDLNSSDPKLVVAANLDDKSGTAIVHLTRSVNFSDANEFPPEEGAIVNITDSEGAVWNLAPSAPGLYVNNSLMGVPGRTYFLEIVTASGATYTAQSTLPQPVPLDSIRFIEFTFGPPGSGGGDSLTYVAIPKYFDPLGVQNNYRFVQILNGKTDSEIIVRNDNIFNGKVNEQPIFSPEIDLHSGDTLTLQMMGLDRSAYDYFFSLSSLIGSGPNNSGVPANPVSNINNGALGYFSAHNLQIMTAIVP